MATTDHNLTDHRVQTICLLTITLMAVGAALYFLQPVLVPFVLAVLLTYCLSPLIDLQMRHLRIPRGVAIAVSAALALIALTLCGAMLAASAGNMSSKLEGYQRQFQQLTEHYTQTLALDRLGIASKEQISRFFASQEGTGWQFLSTALRDATNLISNGALVIVFMIFILFGRRAQQRPAAGVLGEIRTRVKRYILLTVLFAGLSGVLVGVTLAALGVEFAWMFGLLTFLLNFIPSVGSVIATLLPLPVILLTPEMSVTAKVLALAIPAAIQFIIGNIVQPRVMGDSLNLHPVVVLMALIFFGMIWGVIGAFLATPITAVVRIIFEKIPITRPLADVLAGNLDVLSGADDAARAPPYTTSMPDSR